MSVDGNESSTPSTMTVDQFVERRGPIGVDYAELVQRIANARDLDAADAKAYISKVGRRAAFQEVRG